MTHRATGSMMGAPLALDPCHICPISRLSQEVGRTGSNPRVEQALLAAERS